MAAMESLGLLGDREAVGPLRELATSADPELAFAARSALARIAGGEPADELVDDDFTG
jgi:HEAT repeat protein